MTTTSDKAAEDKAEAKKLSETKTSGHKLESLHVMAEAPEVEYLDLDGLETSLTELEKTFNPFKFVEKDNEKIFLVQEEEIFGAGRRTAIKYICFLTAVVRGELCKYKVYLPLSREITTIFSKPGFLQIVVENSIRVAISEFENFIYKPQVEIRRSLGM